MIHQDQRKLKTQNRTKTKKKKKKQQVAIDPKGSIPKPDNDTHLGNNCIREPLDVITALWKHSCNMILTEVLLFQAEQPSARVS